MQIEEQLRQVYFDLSSGTLSQSEALEKIKATRTRQQAAAGTLLLRPAWEASSLVPSETVPEYADHQVLLREIPETDAGPNLAKLSSDCAVACFEQIQAILRNKPAGKVLVQIAVPSEGPRAVLAGLSGLLKTAALESPQITGQLIVVPPQTSTAELDQLLQQEKRHGRAALVRYDCGERQVMRWREVEPDTKPVPAAFQEDGVYLITGGLGALGRLFAKEILQRNARVVLAGRQPHTGKIQEMVDGLSAKAGRLIYRQIDVANLDQVRRAVEAVHNEYGRLNGVLHCAGTIRDNFLLKKTSAEFRHVIESKVAGTFNIDEATHSLELDFFAMFSSIAGALGNVGQADYAVANAFMDQFAAYRNGRAAAKKLYGRTLSINWPLWQDGGMSMDAESRELFRQNIGFEPMQTAIGIEMFRRCLALPHARILVANGDTARIRRALLSTPQPPQKPRAAAAVHLAPGDLLEKTLYYLCKELSEILKLPAAEIDAHTNFGQYGIDSILAMRLTSQLEKSFGALAKTLFFEYQTVFDLAGYFIGHYADRLGELVAPRGADMAASLPDVALLAPAASLAAPPDRLQRRRFRAASTASAASASIAAGAPSSVPRQESEPIAIVGLSGRYPEAPDIEAYWRNLRDGKDCIVEVPKDRWDWRDYYSQDRAQPGCHFSKWGGFIAGADQFDPLFFSISPREAKHIDPQERLFLQHAWMAVEDAGYTRAALQEGSGPELPAQVGVYAGVMYSEYQLFNAETRPKDLRMGFAGNLASIANRVSYFLNLHGPSMTLDTMCSSSLTAIHVACQDLKLGRTSMAIAGGVNVSVHPNKYLMLSAGQFISSDGHCQSFGEGGDGYIPGEGVGVAVLKRLSDARRDGDHIYGIIRGSALNHGGRTSGYTVPNPAAQAGVIRLALAEARIDPRHISYVEAHGTGTKLGDPIEIAALSKAFGTRDTGFCLIGSAKSNIGHCESAAGIAGLTKVLLQMRHREIAPSLHSAQLNPHIDFAATPFVVNQSLRPWEQPAIDGRKVARIAGLSSFGAGGSNAHMIIEEPPAESRVAAAPAEAAIVLSARTAAQLQEKASGLLGFLRARTDAIDLSSLAYTLQVGREAMEERLGFAVSSVEQLTEKLEVWLGGAGSIEGCYRGQAKRNRALSVADAATNHPAALAEQWVKGAEPDWSALYGGARPRRISLPAYPFARERYWVDAADAAKAPPRAASIEHGGALHPLLHRNTSDRNGLRFSSTFTGGGQKEFSAGACLEMACAAFEQAWTERPEAAVLELSGVQWGEPAAVGENTELHIALVADGFEIWSGHGAGEIVHCQGRAQWTERPAVEAVDSGRLRPLPAAAPERLLEAALEASSGLGNSPWPSALDSLRILSPRASGTAFWAREAPGAVDGAVSLDLDLCDARGNVCARMRGVSWRAASAPIPAASPLELLKPELPMPELPELDLPKKAAGIALSLPEALPPAPAAARPKPTISLVSLDPPDPVAVAGQGGGIFAIRISAEGTGAQLLQALDRLRQEESLKVLTIGGTSRSWLAGGRAEIDDAADRGLYQALATFPYPVIAAVEGRCSGAGLLAAALCDFLVLSKEASLECADPSPAEMAVFGERFGEAAAQSLLLGRPPRSCPAVERGQVEEHARNLAAELASKPQKALRLLKEHRMRRLAALALEVRPIEPAAQEAAVAGDARLVHSAEELAQALESGCQAIVVAGEGIEGIPERLLLESPVPLVAALDGDARGNAWLASLLCDACVYRRDGVYSARGPDGAIDRSRAAAEAFTHRLGGCLGAEVLLTGAEYSGAELEQRGGAIAAERNGVVAAAAMLAARLPRGSFALREKLASVLDELDERDEPVPEEEPPAAAAPFTLRSPVVGATLDSDGIAVVRMEDREARNMFSEALREGVREAFAAIERSPACKVVVLTGYDTYFSSGGTPESLLAIQQGHARFTDFDIFQVALDCPLPVVAAMQGHGIGAGWCLGLFADIALLSEESRYISPYMNYGFTPGAGATWILPAKLGTDLAWESLMTGRQYTGSELKLRGAPFRVTPRAETEQAAMELARRIAQAPRGQLKQLKRQLTAQAAQALKEVYRRELAMHEATFVGQSEALSQIRSQLLGERAEEAPAAAPAPATADSDALPAVAASLRTLLADELQMRESEIDDRTQFVDLGLDSISGVTWVRKINGRYGTSIEATKVYSYPTLEQMSRFVLEEMEKHGKLAAPAIAPAAVPAAAQPPMPLPALAPAFAKLASWRRRNGGPRPAQASAPAAIAVIGMAGQFPQARNVAEFWRNIAQGRNCIAPVPADRWDLGAYYRPGNIAPGKTNSQWCGCLEDYDRFDPLFFNLSPTEAESMDPQQRLFLEACWAGIEDAGYDARALSGSRCGVFVGVAGSDYHNLSRQHQLSAQGFTGGATSILTARISYFLNLRGPAIPVDTACSSSLVAIAQACDSLVSGVCDMALAGGVYVMTGPEMHIKTAQAGMLSPQGRCFSFDQRADGFVPGEAVGVVVLKRLADAERDRDIVHAVIRGWGVNQDGKTNGITAPNPESQARLEREVYDRYRLDPERIQLIEAHGTGTKLGDPIEVEALRQAFGKYTRQTGYCALGSVKSNIGHCLTAAGIAGFLKLVLALKHRQLPPTINFERLNEHIDLEGSPFYVNGRLREWEPKGEAGRQAAVSSFGFSGTNAHLVLAEYAPPRQAKPAVEAVRQDGKLIVPLSARRPEQLKQRARDLARHLRENPAADLLEVAYTLQVGREAMEERAAFLADSVQQLIERLDRYADGSKESADCWQGQVKQGKEVIGFLSQDQDMRETVLDKWIGQRKLGRLAEWWVKGLELDWKRLYGEAKPSRIALPTYPFARERYWIDAAAEPAQPGAMLHPLLHRNTSDLNEQRYSSVFTGEEPFLMDHQVRAEAGGMQKVLPGVAFLEMARAAIERACPDRPAASVLELRNTVWAAPVAISRNRQIDISLATNDDGSVEYDIYSQDGGKEIVHCQGSAVWSTRTVDESIREFAPAQAGTANWVLHPVSIDRALAQLPNRTGMPAALDSLRILAPCTAEMSARVRSRDALLDIDLCDERGDACAELRGLSFSNPAGIVTLLFTPAWQPSSIETGAADYAEHHVVLLELPNVEAASLEQLAPDCRCFSPRMAEQQNIAQRYGEYALACFERIQTIFRSTSAGKALVQIVAADSDEQPVLAGLSGLLRTAALEKEQFRSQLILVPPLIASAELAALLANEMRHQPDTVVKYQDGERQVLRWQEAPVDSEAPLCAFKDDGVYLITGGLGSLGMLLAKDILEHTRRAKAILTGRSPLSPQKQVAIENLGAQSDRVSYCQLDLSAPDRLREQIGAIRNEHRRLDGILHCAGMTADSLLLNKSNDRFNEVLAPKVTGTYNLDEATCDVELDFFALFSSIAGAIGNAGQADYAAANAFMDHFAAHRNRLVALGRRHGRTRSINWPLWQAGGTSMDAASLEVLRQATGFEPLETGAGLAAFHRALALPFDQILVVHGAQPKMTDYLRKRRILPPSATVEPEAARAQAPPSPEQLHRQLKTLVASILRIDADLIDLDQPFVEFGLDSFLGTETVAAINRRYNTELSAISLFDHPTVRELSRLLEQEIAKLPASAPAPPDPSVVPPVLNRKIPSSRMAAGNHREPEDKIAVVGMSGRYPQAPDLRRYWNNLAAGRNAIVEVPAWRWDAAHYYDPDRARTNKTYSKWLGALDDIDCFDPLFFRISPQEAEYMDPQHRLFLQESYRAFEDAGYCPSTLSNRKCGVYLGITTNEYMQLVASSGVMPPPVTSNSFAIASARIAYYLNLKGPAISVDTACSSSLVAIHLACQALLGREVDMALAGGVSLWLTPGSYVAMSQAGMFSPSGQCKTFDDSADGIVNGEGVGAVVLKRLSDAQADGDTIYGVILGSAINQDGKTNGITAPSVNSQIELERAVYARHGIDPETIGYVETHGTGTKLGDPIELEALSAVFKERTAKKQFCGLGAVKSNIGHTTAAAGVAGLQKVLLSMRHRMMVPTLHVTKLNSRFNFEDSPFYVSREMKPWDAAPGAPRRAAVSSFGFSGTNAHLVVQEYTASSGRAVQRGGNEPVAIPLSARTGGQLRQRAQDLLDWMRISDRTEPIDLPALAYTLQTGREGMEERMGFVVTSAEDLEAKLGAFAAGAQGIEGAYRGRIEPGAEAAATTGWDSGMPEVMEKWAKGFNIDWNKLYNGRMPRRVSLPTYPFAKERYWIDGAARDEEPARWSGAAPDMKSIEDILGRLADDAIETDLAVESLKMLV